MINKERNKMKKQISEYIDKFSEYIDSHSKFIYKLCSNRWVLFFSVICCLWVEFSAAQAIGQKSWFPYQCVAVNWISYIILVLLTIFFIFKIRKEGKWFRVDLFRLLTSAIGRKWLSLFFLLVFLMQITWFIDTTFEIVVHGKIGWESLYCLLPLITMVALNVFFPSVDTRPSPPINPEKRTFLVTGFSTVSNITYNNIDLFLKPFLNLYGDIKYNIQEVVILCSSTLFKADFCLSLDDIMKLYKDGVDADTLAEFDKSLRKYNDKEFGISNRPEKFKDIIRDIIKINTKVEVDIHLSQNINYDDFNTAYDEIGKVLSKWEKNTERTVINVSPGTKMLTCALTLHALKGHRLIFFTEQVKQDDKKAEQKNVPKSIDVNVFSISDLIRDLIDEYDESDKKDGEKQDNENIIS